MSEYEDKGDKACRRSWLNIFPDIDSAQDNYNLAANTYKRDKKWSDSARCFIKSAKIAENNDERLLASKSYMEAGQCLMNINDENYINCYLSAISLYDKSGHFSQSGKVYKLLAEKNFSEGNYNKAIEYYKRSAESFSLDEYSKSNYSQAIMSYAELISQYSESYFEAMRIFEDEARKALDNKLLQYGAKTILFKAGLLSLALGDVDNGQISFEKYLQMDNRFQHSREAQFLSGIIDSMSNKDCELFIRSVESYEQVALVSAWERHFIDKIKLYLLPFASKDILNRDDMNDSDEVDLIVCSAIMEGSMWTEHISKDGRKYYYNSQTKKSQWIKPDELLTPEELAIANNTPWQEYTSTDGRTYWHNKITKKSVWDMPSDLKALKDLIAQKEAIERNYMFMSKMETKEQAKEEIFKYFQERGINHKSNWESSIKLFETDPKWECFVMFTRGDRKQLFNEYINQSQRKAQEEERKLRQKAREIILEELSSWQGIDASSTYSEFAKEFHTRDWWSWLDERERDNIFQDYLQNNLERAREMKRVRKKAAISHFTSKLSNYGDGIHMEKWEDVKPIIESDDMFKHIDMAQALSLWQDEFKRRERLELEEINRTEYRIFRKNRDAFREYLKKSNVNLDTRWSDFLQVCNGHPEYQKMVGQPGSACWELFADYIRLLKKEFNEDRRFIIDLIGDNKIDSVESLSKILKGKREISYENLNRIYEWLKNRCDTMDTSDIDSESSVESISK